MTYPNPADVARSSTVLGASDGVPLEIAPGVLLLLDATVWYLPGSLLRAAWLRDVMEGDWLKENLIEGDYLAVDAVPIARLKPSLRFFDADAGVWKLKPSISTDGTFLGLKPSILRWTD